MDILESPLEASEQKDDGSMEADEVTLVNPQDDGDGDEADVSLAGTQLTLDPNVQYQFRTDGGQGGMTYRVIQVQPDSSPEHATTAALPISIMPSEGILTNAVIQSPFSNGSSPSDGATATYASRNTFVPTVTTETGELGQQEIATAALGQVATAGGQFYVMMSPQDVLQGQRALAPRSTSAAVKSEGQRTSRDDRRRATHNEVERRRRDKINNWIVQLSKVVPDCAAEQGKSGQVNNRSKGGILSKACDYITSLTSANVHLTERLKEVDKLQADMEILRQQCDELKQENALLRTQLQQSGLSVTEMVPSS